MSRRLRYLIAGIASIGSSFSASAIESNVFTQADLGFVEVEGSSLRTAGMRAGAMIEFAPALQAGLSAGAVTGTQKAGLFDQFDAYDVSLEFATSVHVGPWQPFISFRVPIKSEFYAGGSMTDYPVHTMPGSTPRRFSIEGKPGTYYRSDSLKRGYDFRGKMHGADVAVGSGWAVTDKISLTASLGYSARSLKVTTTRTDPGLWKDLKWGFEERQGMTVTETDGEIMLEPKHKTSTFAGTVLSMGMNYKL